LFDQNRSVQKSDTELVILVTPRVVRYADHKGRAIYAGAGSLDAAGAAPVAEPVAPPPANQPAAPAVPPAAGAPFGNQPQLPAGAPQPPPQQQLPQQPPPQRQ